MFRNIKARKRLVALLLPLFLISGFLAFQTSSTAQIGCPGNLLQNGDFATGVIAAGNGNFPPSTVPNWSTAFGSPQIVASMGCNTPNFVKMWGNKVVGEGIKQTVNIQAGHTYRLSACVRVDTTNPTLPNYVRFNVRAWSSSSPITYTGAAPVIGLTPNITATTWTPVTLATNWTAPSNLDTITINPENDNTANDGNTVSWGWIDNVCLQEVIPPCFTANTVCQGQPTTFTSCATNAASWSWNFGDGTSSNQQNPTHVYGTSGMFNVTHCVNGSTNCVTNQVTVKAAPPTPVITGPNNVYAGQTATYSASPAGLSYSWTVNGGTFIGPSTGNSVNVMWTGSGGSIAVTATNKEGCSSTARMVVGSDLFQCESCKDLQTKTDLTSFSHVGGGVYNVTPTLSVNKANIIRVTADVISSTATYSPLSCGTAGPVNSSVVSASNVSATGGVNLVAMVPLAGGHEVIWHGSAPSVNGLSFPMQIKFPPPPTGKCTDALTFCIKYTFTTKDCRTCEVIRCYGPFKRNGPIKTEEEIKIITLTP